MKISTAQAKLDDIGTRRRKIAKDTERLNKDAADVIAAARTAGIEASEVSERTGWARSWLYRQFKDQMGVRPAPAAISD